MPRSTDPRLGATVQADKALQQLGRVHRSNQRVTEERVWLHGEQTEILGHVSGQKTWFEELNSWNFHGFPASWSLLRPYSD